MCVCVSMVCLFECVKKRGEINPMLSSIPGYEFTASVWASHCLNNNLINPVFISFTELGREDGREDREFWQKISSGEGGERGGKKRGVWWGLKSESAFKMNCDVDEPRQRKTLFKERNLRALVVGQMTFLIHLHTFAL